MVRIVRNTTKVAVITAATVVALLLGLQAESLVTTSGAIVTPILMTAAIVFMARTFRGDDEPVAPPRPWWRATAKPTSGFVVSALLISAVIRPFPSAWTGDGSTIWGLGGVLYFLTALWFFIGAIRQSGSSSTPEGP